MAEVAGGVRNRTAILISTPAPFLHAGRLAGGTTTANNTFGQ
jgi:hypothetical protein